MPGREHRFRRLYADIYADVLRFVQRRTDDAAVAEDVVATVAEERFALWMPGDELRDAHSDGVEVEVTYADGTMENVRLSY